MKKKIPVIVVSGFLGSGKTTLLKILSGLLKPISGSIIVNKKDMLKGKNVVTDLDRHDIGQAVVVKKGYIISIEGIEGTDVMLDRAEILIKKFYSQKNKGGILLKFPKKKLLKRFKIKLNVPS